MPPIYMPEKCLAMHASPSLFTKIPHVGLTIERLSMGSSSMWFVQCAVLAMFTGFFSSRRLR